MAVNPTVANSGLLRDLNHPLGSIAAAFALDILDRIGLEVAHQRRIAAVFARYSSPTSPLEVRRMLSCFEEVPSQPLLDNHSAPTGSSTR